jgi:F-type H+-transporting ATPase subunit delta
MQNPRLASRYAKSLIDLAIEKGELEKVNTDMQLLQRICRSNRDFVLMLRSPVITSDVKGKIIDAILTGKLSPMTEAFIRLLVNKGREANLPEISEACSKLYKEHKNIHTIKLSTATVLSEDLKNEIISQIRKSSQMENVEIETVVNEDLIGGFVLQVGDKLVDASISYDLKEIAKQFENNDFIYNVR